MRKLLLPFLFLIPITSTSCAIDLTAASQTVQTVDSDAAEIILNFRAVIEASNLPQDQKDLILDRLLSASMLLHEKLAKLNELLIEAGDVYTTYVSVIEQLIEVWENR